MIALVSVDDWFTLGVYLGVEYHTLEKIREDHLQTDWQYNHRIIDAWLKRFVDCTKHKLSTALRYISYSM